MEYRLVLAFACGAVCGADGLGKGEEVVVGSTARLTASSFS